MLSNEEWEEQQRRESEERRARWEDRKAERECERQPACLLVAGPVLFGIMSAAAIMVVCVVPIKIVDWSNCEDACEKNGDKPFWQVSMGCLCDDGDSLYNPKDER